ncbi:hypothetical protein G647_05820 [Cladophialophora carrionii CBS 160.54]|uniref:Xylanolytic transcriptional activator regulatory domain-containing protein n=1 Tax=Cladophialophora carrionii CBS 160.54 TaxID=1279043 RepID=V9D510_9EURO|nr:uncharacterized protein G647_05820 [Cladophialophora carrionii CBS 160.54]ETI21751.1 hypothetical protein G647_05820 [Cladophialophora carrionii CBS 160.54]
MPDNCEWTPAEDENWSLSTPNSLRQTASSQSSTRRPIRSQLSWNQSSGKDLILPPKVLITHLVEVYFDYVHPQIRLFHQPSFVPWVESSSFVSDGYSTLLLLAMFSLAARYSDQPEVDLFDRSLRQMSGCRNTQDGASHKIRKRWDRGKGFLSQANRLLMGEISKMDNLELKSGGMQRPSIALVQAAALLTFAQLGMGLNSRAFSILSMTVRLAYDCGLDQVDSYDKTMPNPKGTGVCSSRSIWVEQEELRRAWWAVADLENFVCVTKDRPRLIDWESCKTKLPCDDKDWFEGRDRPSVFLPVSLHDLRASLALPSQLSVLACRIMTMHLVAKLIKAAIIDDSVPQSQDLFYTIEECATAWKQNMPMGWRTEPPLQKTPGQPDVSTDCVPLRIGIEWRVSKSSPRVLAADQSIQYIVTQQQDPCI